MAEAGDVAEAVTGPEEAGAGDTNALPVEVGVAEAGAVFPTGGYGYGGYGYGAPVVNCGSGGGWGGGW